MRRRQPCTPTRQRKVSPGCTRHEHAAKNPPLRILERDPHRLRRVRAERVHIPQKPFVGGGPHERRRPAVRRPVSLLRAHAPHVGQQVAHPAPCGRGRPLRRVGPAQVCWAPAGLHGEQAGEAVGEPACGERLAARLGWQASVSSFEQAELALPPTKRGTDLGDRLWRDVCRI